MTELTTYHLEPPEAGAMLSFHFGRQGIGLEEASEALASDSLFAALVAQAATLDAQRGPHGEPTWATAFGSDSGTPPLALSSLFPRVGDLTLLPRPLLKLDLAEPHNKTIGKGFKKLRYLSPVLFSMICRGEQIAVEPVIMQGGKVWISAAEAAKLPKPWKQEPRETDSAWRARLRETLIWQIEEVARVTVDRASSASAYYEVGRVVYAPGCGLALLVRFADESVRPEFERLLCLLSESGLGGRRSSGYGAFAATRQAQPLDLGLAAGGQRAVLLSRYLPANDAELDALRNARSNYQLVDVGGWLYSIGRPAQRRQRIRMVAEGAVLDVTAGLPRGRVADVRPDYRKSSRPHPIIGSGQGTDHPVYRSGLALTLPIPDAEAKEGA